MWDTMKAVLRENFINSDIRKTERTQINNSMLKNCFGSIYWQVSFRLIREHIVFSFLQFYTLDFLSNICQIYVMLKRGKLLYDLLTSWVALDWSFSPHENGLHESVLGSSSLQWPLIWVLSIILYELLWCQSYQKIILISLSTKKSNNSGCVLWDNVSLTWSETSSVAYEFYFI